MEVFHSQFIINTPFKGCLYFVSNSYNGHFIACLDIILILPILKFLPIKRAENEIVTLRMFVNMSNSGFISSHDDYRMYETVVSR